jgi:hypothetical protein
LSPPGMKSAAAGKRSGIDENCRDLGLSKG